MQFKPYTFSDDFDHSRTKHVTGATVVGICTIKEHTVETPYGQVNCWAASQEVEDPNLDNVWFILKLSVRDEEGRPEYINMVISNGEYWAHVTQYDSSLGNLVIHMGSYAMSMQSKVIINAAIVAYCQNKSGQA